MTTRIDPATLSFADQYKLVTGTIVPRPIALVTTTGSHGPGAAPFSFFNAVAVDPTVVMFSIGRAAGEREGQSKDTLLNLQEVPEFVVHIVSNAVREKMNVCAMEFPRGINEIERAGFRTAPSERVRPPRLVDCPVQWECRLLEIKRFGDSPYRIVFGEVVLMHYAEGVVNERRHVDLERLDPIGRLAASGGYVRMTDRFLMPVPPLE